MYKILFICHCCLSIAAILVIVHSMASTTESFESQQIKPSFRIYNRHLLRHLLFARHLYESRYKGMPCEPGLFCYHKKR